jgi:ABC-2 type transport system ATP-binding protein
MTNTERAIETRQLTKVYGDFRALDALDLIVPQGSLFGLLGPNGAGKTTLLRILFGYIKASGGSASVFGIPAELDSKGVRSIAAYLPAEAKLFRAMKGSKVLRLFSELHPHGNLALATSIAERLKLDTSRLVGFMSTGMRQKLALACVLGIRCRLLILDEPTANLDPTVRNEVLSIVKEVHQGGSTVVFSSHLLDEVDELCDQAAIVGSGKVKQLVDLRSTRSTYAVGIKDSVPYRLDQFPAGVTLNDGNKYELIVDTGVISLNEAIVFLAKHNIVIDDVQQLGLKTVYDACSASC